MANSMKSLDGGGGAGGGIAFVEKRVQQVEHIGWEELDKWRYFTIGPALMLGVRLIIFPPVLIRTRLQVQKKQTVYKGTIDAFRKIYKLEGFRGFYKGFATSNLTLISGQMYVSVLELTRAKINTTNETLKSLIAGTLASLIAQTVTVPVDIVSQKQMMAGQNVTGRQSSRSALSLVLEITRTSGLKGFYKGYLASILTFTPNSGIWWAAYYYFNQLIGSRRPKGTPDIVVQGMSGPLASIVASCCTNPMDVVRTRLQVHGGNKGTISSTFYTLYNEEGIRGLYKGLSARLTHSIPSGFLLIVTYEMIKKLSKKSEPGYE